MPVFRELVAAYNASVHVIHWDHKKLTPYSPPNIQGVTFYPRSALEKCRMLELSNQISPDIIYISGWQDLDYLSIAARMRKLGKPVVVGFDDQWKGSIRQHIGSLILRHYLRGNFFSHAWVAGPYQFEYARRMGFKKSEIIFNLLSCDTALFESGISSLALKAINYPQRFLYVGNFRDVKGTDVLLHAYRIYREEYKGEWFLTCIGNGPMEYLFKNYPDVDLRGFSSQSALLDIVKEIGAFILPSRFDQWGVVVHEFALSGLPLILSENVGCCPVFLIDGFNGYRYSDNCPESLAKRMHLLSSKSGRELVQMGKSSHELAKAITPSRCAAALISTIAI